MAPHALRKLGQDGRGFRHQVELGRVLAARVRPKTMFEREHDLESRSPGADHGQRLAGLSRELRQAPIDGGKEGVDRLHGDRMTASAVNRIERRGRSGIDRKQIELVT